MKITFEIEETVINKYSMHVDEDALLEKYSDMDDVESMIALGNPWQIACDEETVSIPIFEQMVENIHTNMNSIEII